MKRKTIIILIVMLAILMLIHLTTPYKVFSLNWWKSLFPPKLINITDQLPTGPCMYNKRNLNQVTDITVHHTAGPVTQSPEQLAAFHTNNRQYCGLAYHILVYPDKIYLTQPLDTISWHNGYNNTNAVGVAMVGDFSTTPPPKKQMDKLVNIIRYLRRILPNSEFVTGHGEVKKTSCPGKTVDMDKIRSLTGGRPRNIAA